MVSPLQYRNVRVAVVVMIGVGKKPAFGSLLRNSEYFTQMRIVNLGQ
jgi:hypothetical protein